MQQLTQTLHCLECAFRTTVTDELFRHQHESGHMDFQLCSVYTFRRERILAVLPPVGLS
jgi:hypothetical protein